MAILYPDSIMCEEVDTLSVHYFERNNFHNIVREAEMRSF